MIRYHSNKVHVLPSEGKGRGVFARRDFKEGDIIECAPTILISEKEWLLVEPTNLGNYVFETEEGQVAVALGYVSLYNHGFKTNATFDAHNEYIKIFASNKISKGDEILVDYNWDAFHYFENKMINKEEYKRLQKEEDEEDES